MNPEITTLFRQAQAYCTKETADLPAGATLTIALAQPELAQHLIAADAAALAGNAEQCKAHLRRWMLGWVAAAKAYQTDRNATLSLDFPA